MRVSNIRSCPICESFDFNEIIYVAQAPKFHVISAETELGSHLFGEVRLVECLFCKHLFNNAIQDKEKNPGHGSFSTNAPVSQSMFDRRKKIMEFLSADGDLSLNVLEVGAGSGALAAIFAESKNLVTVVEPELTLDADHLEKQGVRVIRDVWPTNKLISEKFDLILCVQVLEHTEKPREFLHELANCIHGDGRIYLEVPSGDWVKTHGSAADVHFPHWNYFTETMIQKLISECNLKISKRCELVNGRDIGYILQHIAIKSDYSFQVPLQAFDLDKLEESLEIANSQIIKWNTSLDYAFYGTNSQSQAAFGLLTGCKPKFVFDDTPSYRGSFAYSSQFRFPIIEPSSDRLKEVDVVVISVYIHDEAIAKKIRELGFDGEIYSLRPPSDPSGKVKSLFSEI
ncbi:unannotated protein [freshwater metagenome]|uniref:Unannotated protein n=1 Tax=freshwater metagenome TaxID=449393 RepID=A0A6J6B8L4_9ZZZZ|nr:methyltransferase domain-containing protein [Actinomycetota bacterium]